MGSEITVFVALYYGVTTDRIDRRESTLTITKRTDTIKISKITLFIEISINLRITTIFIISHYFTFKRAESINTILRTMVTLFTIVEYIITTHSDTSRSEIDFTIRAIFTRIDNSVSTRREVRIKERTSDGTRSVSSKYTVVSSEITIFTII